MSLMSSLCLTATPPRVALKNKTDFIKSNLLWLFPVNTNAQNNNTQRITNVSYESCSSSTTTVELWKKSKHTFWGFTSCLSTLRSVYMPTVLYILCSSLLRICACVCVSVCVRACLYICICLCIGARLALCLPRHTPFARHRDPSGDFKISEGSCSIDACQLPHNIHTDTRVYL